ncbi:MAG: CPBP family intramembrane glutamic endopeptidase [Chloroflexota bacterium]
MTKSNHSCFTKEVIAAIILCYAIAGIILFCQVGLWEMIRHIVVNGAIVLAWLWSASVILRDAPLPESEPIRYPTLELGWLLMGLLVAVGFAANGFAGWMPLPRWLYYVAIYGATLILFVGLRYPTRSLGLAWPPKRGWLAVLVAVLINIVAAILFQVLPPGEAVKVPQSDLANQITGPMSVLIVLAGLLFRAALPEELLLRVGLQPRLAQFVLVGWAILIQALLFSAGHLPQRIILYHESPLLALGYILTVDNGLIGGYLWQRTRSLPLLLVLHLFAYPRLGI